MKLILGENHNIFLNYLDEYLMNLSKKSKGFLLFSAGLMLIHFSVFKASRVFSFDDQKSE